MNDLSRVRQRDKFEIAFDLDGVVVEQDHGCHAGFTWRAILPDPSLSEATVVELPGFDVVRTGFGVTILDHVDGRRLVVVPRTGRIQLRLGYLTAKGQRTAAARAFGRTLHHAWLATTHG